jgi:hypothetical protein
MSVQARPAAVHHQQVAAAIQIRTEPLNSRLPSSYVSSLFNVRCRAAAVEDDPAVAEEDFLVPVVVADLAAEVEVVDDPVVAAEVDDRSEIHSTDRPSTCGNCRVQTTF